MGGVLAFLVSYPLAHAAHHLAVTVESPAWSRAAHCVHYLGEVTGYGKFPVTAPESGWLKGPRVTQGARVHPGQELGVIVPPELAAQLRNARASLKLTAVQLQAAKRLYHHSYAAQLSLDAARDSWVAAKAKLDGLLREKDSDTLRSPAGGTVHYRYPVGSYINDENTTPVVAFVDLSRPLWLSVYVTGFMASKLRPGKRITLQGSGWTGVGKIRSINSSAQRDGMVEVMVSLPNGRVFRQGQWMRAGLCLEGGHAWRVPEKALLINGGQAQVYVINRVQRAIPIKVQIVSSSSAWVWVKGKLSRSSKLVVNGADRVRRGLKVHIRSQPRTY